MFRNGRNIKYVRYVGLIYVDRFGIHNSSNSRKHEMVRYYEYCFKQDYTH